MGTVYTIIVLQFIVIFFINLGCGIANLYAFIVDGIQILVVVGV